MLDAAQDRLTLATHRLQRETDEQRDEQRLQHIAFGQRREQRVRDDVLDEVHESAGLVRLLGELGALACRALGQVHAASGVDQVADHQADRQREGRHHQEVDERQAADLADGGGFAHRPDAQHDRAEDDRRDHHLDQADEHRAEHADALADLGREQADGDAGQHRDDDGDVEPVGAVAAARGGSCTGGLSKFVVMAFLRVEIQKWSVWMFGEDVSQVTF